MITTGTIGGPETFAGQATGELRVLFPYLAEPAYFDSGAGLYAALADSAVQAIIGAAEGLGGTTSLVNLLHDAPAPLFVVAEAQLAFRCALLGRRGARIEDVRTVLGGPVSLEQARAFLRERLPRVVAANYHDPLATAQRIANGDGSEAVLGTLTLADRFGLEVLARDVDGGIVNANIWALSSAPHFDPAPGRVLVAGRFGYQGELGAVIGRMAAVGFTLETMAGRANGKALFGSDYLLRFAGQGSLEAVERALDGGAGRLVGALQNLPIS